MTPSLLSSVGTAASPVDEKPAEIFSRAEEISARNPWPPQRKDLSGLSCRLIKPTSRKWTDPIDVIAVVGERPTGPYLPSLFLDACVETLRAGGIAQICAKDEETVLRAQSDILSWLVGPPGHA